MKSSHNQISNRSRLATELPSYDRASSVLPRGQWLETLDQSGPTWARGVVMNKGGVSLSLESISATDHFMTFAAITPALQTFK